MSGLFRTSFAFRHYKNLEHCLLPLVIIVLKNTEDEAELKDWIRALLDAFFQGFVWVCGGNELNSREMPQEVFLHWAATFVDVMSMLCRHFGRQRDEQVLQWLEDAAVHFLQIHLDRGPAEGKETEARLRRLLADFLTGPCCLLDDSGQLAEELVDMLLEKAAGCPDLLRLLLASPETAQNAALLRLLRLRCLEEEQLPEDILLSILRQGFHRRLPELELDGLEHSLVRLCSLRPGQPPTAELLDAFKFLVERGKLDGAQFRQLINVSFFYFIKINNSD